MPSVHEQYTSELRSKYGYLAAWLPNSKRSLGDVGVLRRDRFEYVTNLQQLGIEFRATPPGAPADLQYTSTGAVEFHFNAGASAPGAEEPLVRDRADVTVTFKRANAVVFLAKQSRTQTISDLRKLERELLSRQKSGRWSVGHVVVTELVTVESATILISNSANARISFEASGGQSLQEFLLADATAGLRTVSSSGVDAQVIAAAALTPLFRASGLRRRIMGIKLENRFTLSGPNATPEPTGPLELVDVDYPDTE